MPKINIYHQDCLQAMKEMEDNLYDLAIVDPPYGINATNMQMGFHPTRNRNDGHGSGPGVSTAVKLKGRLNQGSGKLKNRILNKSSIGWDNEIPSEDYFQHLRKVSKNQIIWGGNYFDLRATRGFAVWNKMQPWENFSQCELAWTSFDMPAKLISLSNTGGRNKEIKIHPTQKPVKLYEWLLMGFAKSGDKILDTHGGSMSIAIACHNLGFDLDIFEIDKDYFESGKKRFEIHKKQLKLFTT